MLVAACQAIFIADTGRSYEGEPVSRLPEILAMAVRAAILARAQLGRYGAEMQKQFIEFSAKSMGALGAMTGGGK